MGFRYKDGKKVLRFSIRKYHFGAASVAIASLIFFGGMSAKAENIPTQQSGDKITSNSSSSGTSKGDDGDSDADDKNISIESDKSIKIAKGDLQKLSISLKTSIKATEKEKYSAIAKELDEILDGAKVVLDNKDAKLEEVNEQIKILTKAAEKFDKTVDEANKKLEEKKATDQHKAEATEKSDSPKDESTKKDDSPKTAEKKADKATEKDGPELAENRPAETIKNDGTTAKIQPKEGVTLKENAENPGKEKELPTYTNGVDTDKLAEEINNISTYLSENGANATKVELLKSKYSKLKSKLEVAKNGVLSEEDFNEAVSDLKDARDTIAKFLADKQAGGTSENTPKIEAILNPVERRKETDKSSVTGLISEKKAKLARLQKEIEEKFGELNQINVASTEDIVKNVNTLQSSITEALRSSQGNADELDALASQATRLRNSLANAIQRTHSGKRDLRNGSRMARGADFRASSATEDLNTTRAYIAKGGTVTTKTGYTFTLPKETYIYSMNRSTNPNYPINNRPQANVGEALDEANITVKKDDKDTTGKTFIWEVTFNSSNQSHQNAYYWFTLPKGHTIGELLAATRTSNGNRSYGTSNFDDEWGRKIKEHLSVNKAVFGLAKNYHFDDTVDSITDLTNVDFIAGTKQRSANNEGNRFKTDGRGFYYLGALYRPGGVLKDGNNGVISDSVIDKAERNLKGLKDNTDKLYLVKYDGAGPIKLRYTTTTDNKYAPLYYGAGLRSYEYSSAKHYFMARGLQEKPTAPVISDNNVGTVTVKPNTEKADKVEISYIGSDQREKKATLLRNHQNGTWESNDTGIEVSGTSFIIRPNAVKVGTQVKAKSWFGNSDPSDEATGDILRRTDKPTVTPKEDGSVIVRPSANATHLTISYTDETSKQNKTITADKTGSLWGLKGDSAITINRNSGEVTIPANSVADSTKVEARAKAPGEALSEKAEATAKDQDRIAPTIQVRKNGTRTWLTADSKGNIIVPVAPGSGRTLELDVLISDNQGGSGIPEFSSRPGGTVTKNITGTYKNNTDTYGSFGKASDATAKLSFTLNDENTASDAKTNVTVTLNAKDNAGNWTNAANKKEVTVKVVSAKPNYPSRVKVLNPTNIKDAEKDKILTAIKEANKTNEAHPTFTKGTDGIITTYTDGTTYTVPYSDVITYDYLAKKKTINVGENPNWGDPKQYFTYEDGGAIGNDKTFLWKNSSNTTAPNNPDLTVGTNKTVEVLAANPGGSPKTLTLTYDVVDGQPPKVKINGVELGDNVDQNPRFAIYRGAKFNPTFEVSDNSGNTTYLKASDIPSGVWFNKQGGRDVEKTNMPNNTRYTLTTNNIVDNNNTLGEHTASVTVKDASNNTKTYQFKYVILDIEARNTPETVPLNTKLVDPADERNAKDSHNYVKVSDGNTQKTNGDDYYTTGMKFTWSKDNTPITNKTLLSTPGVVNYTAVVTFPNNGEKYSKTVDGKSITIYPPEKATVSVTFKVKPTAPTVRPENNGDVIVTPANETNVNKVEVTYTPADTNRLENNGNVTKTTQNRTTVIATKGSNNKWTITSGAKEGVSVNQDSGEITLKDQVVKDQTSVEAKVIAQDIESDVARGNSQNGERTAPIIGANSTLVGIGKEVNIPLNLSDSGVGVDYENIKVTQLPSGLRYDSATKSIKGTLSTVSKNDVKVTVLDKNGNKGEKTISIAAVKPKPIYAIKDRTINNVDIASNFVEVPTGVTVTSATWKNGKPTTTTAGTVNKTVTVSATGYTATDVDVPVKVYDRVILKKGTYANALGRLKNGENANDYVNGITQGVTVKWKDNQVPDVSRANPNLKGNIEVSYATDDAEHPIKDTLEVSLPIYSATLTHTSYETTVGTPFEKSDSRTDFFTYVSPPSRLDKVHSVWEKTSGANYSNYASSTRVDNSGVIGKVTDRIRVYYPEYDGSDEWNNKRSEDLAPITFTVKPQAPTLNANDFRGKAGTKPTATVGNLPTAEQLGTDANVTVELYQGTNKVGSKVVSKGTNSVLFNSGDYTANLIVGQDVHAVVKVTGTTNGKAYDLSSANSTLARVTTTAPESPTISQNPEDLVVKATVGQGNSTNATLTYYDANNQAQNVEFTKTGNNWTKSNANNNTNITITNAGVIELKAGVAKEGTNVSVKQRTETSEYSEPATKKVLGRLNGLTNTPKDDGSVEIIVPADATRMTLTYIPQGQTEAKKLEYTKNGTRWTTYPDTQTYSGERKIIIPKEKVADGTTVSAIASNDNSTTTTVVSKAKFEQPNATTSDQRENGDVRITLPNNADTVAVTYKDTQNAAKSVTLTKGAGNQWTSGGNLPTGVTLTGNVLEIPYKNISRDENEIHTVSTRGEGEVRSQGATQDITADHRPPGIQDVVIAAGATPTNEDLGRAVASNKRSVTAKSTPTAVSAGTTVIIPATLTYTDGSTEDINVTVKSRPEKPTFDNIEDHGGAGRGISSTSKTISGSATPGASKVKLTLQNGTIREVIPNDEGKWSYTLQAGEILTQNFTTAKHDTYNPNKVKAVQVKDNVESDVADIDIAIGKPSVDSVYQAGRSITVNVAHDALAGYIKVNNSDYGIIKKDGNWQLVSDAQGRDKLEVTSVVDPNNPAITKVTLSVKNNNEALLQPPFTIGSTPIQFRYHYVKNGVIGTPVARIAGDPEWESSPTPTNTIPTVKLTKEAGTETPKLKDNHVFASPTVDELKDYIAGADKEDDANLTVGLGASDRSKFRIRVFTKETNQEVTANAQGRINPGEYKLVLSTRDAAGAESETIEKNIIVKTMADFYRSQVMYPVNTEKVVYNDTDINNGNFTDAAKERFKDKVKEANVNNRNLPTGVTYTKGNTNDKTRVVGVNFPDGSIIDISHTQVAKPTVPTFTATAGDEHESKLQDIDRIVKGTALQSATKVILKLQTGQEITITKNPGKTPETLAPGESVLTDDGAWAYRLPNDTYLRQTDQTAEIGSSSLPVKVKQIVFDAESDFGEIRVAKERNFEGKTIKGVKGSAELKALRDDAKKGIKYTEKNVETNFPEDFTAVWKNNNKPDITAVGRREYTVELSETRTSSTVNHPGDRTVTVIVTEKAPQTLTYSQKQNGETEINILTDADEVTFKISKGNETATTLVAKKSENWALPNGLLTKSSDNKWKFGSHEDGTYTITAVATAGNGETKSDATTTVITSNSHKVTKADIIKKPTDKLNGTDLYSATGITGIIDNGVRKTYQDAGITSVTSVGMLPTLTPDSETAVPVLITYNDGSQENTTVTLKVAPAAPNVIVQQQNGTTGDVTLTIKRHNDTNYPDDSVVTVPGIDGTFKVKDGTITIKNEQLKDEAQTGKVTVKEEGKLLVETEDNKVIPAKKVASAVPKFGEVSRDGETGDVTIPVTDQNGRALENGTKVTLPGVTGDHSVQDGKVVIKNNELPGEEQSGKGSIEETGKFPTKSTDDVTVPAKKVASAVPKFGEVSRDGETGDVTIPVTDQNGRALENGTKVTLPGVTGDHSVQEGKVVLSNAELPTTETSDKATAQEAGKLPTESDSNVTIPAKLTSAKGEPAIDFKVEIPLPLVVPNPEHLTPTEITDLENRVKKANPGKEVKVDDKGNVTVTDKNTGESTLIPVEDLTVKDFTPVKPEGKVPAKDKDHLTPEEKKQVEEKVKAKNTGKEVTVGDDGTATVTDPTTGISHEIPGTDLVNQDFIPVMPTDKVPVKDPDNLTKEEQDKVKESVEKANPGKNVTIGKAGNVTITDPNTDISHEVPRENLITLAPPVVEIPEFNGGANGELPESAESPKVKLIITKWIDEQGNELKPADAKAPAVLGEVNEAFEHGEFVGYVFVKTETKDEVVIHIFRKVTPTKPTKPEGNGEEQGEDNKPQPIPASPKVDENIKPESTAKVEKSTKRLVNTGEAETNTGLAGLGLGILGSLLAVAKRRKKDEE